MDTSPGSGRQRFSPALKAEVLEACADPRASIPDVAQKYGLSTGRIRRWLRGLGVRQVTSSGDTPKGFLPVRVEPSGLQPGALRIEVHRGDTLIKIDCPAACAADCTDWLKAALQ